MFFDLILLNRQHKTHLGWAWLAATLGVRRVGKQCILEADVVKMCKEIEKYICTPSDSPRSRFSLRLSAILINGCIRIHKQKAVYLMEDVFKAVHDVSKPVQIKRTPGVDITGNFGTPPSPIVKKKGKKRQHVDTEKSTPQSEIDRLLANIRVMEGPIIFEDAPADQASVLPARADEVTLRETMTRKEMGEELGTFGTFPVDEDFLREIEGLDPKRLIGRPSLPIIEEVQEPGPEILPPLSFPHETPPSQGARKQSSSSSENAVVRITVEAQIHASAGFETPEVRPIEQQRVAGGAAVSDQIENIQIAEPEQSERQAQVEEPKRRAVLQPMQDDAVQERDQQVTTRRKRGDNSLAKLFVSTKSESRIVKINRCDLDEIEWIDVNPCSMPEFKLKLPDLTNLLSMYLIRGGEDNTQIRQKTSDVPSLEASVRAIPPLQVSAERNLEEDVPISIVVFPPEEPSGLEIGQPLMMSTPDFEGRRTMEEILPPAAQERLTETPRRGPKLFI